ncbi:Ldh family oxidoreductase [Pseudonocardia alni]|uniref:LDH2 family malate/lactate/ureidoglycolate dehydrogenase n=1 Tax=Pseudonocardia alni TaxID=33907 RepID=A0A852WFD6_PSEA5|nr:Ldh family oxidoreductase [Pseudonocardia antarctica]NYG05404.1 LDH2 family malate/lactate/ureidoglycolate dehydrogenase [Pseudonocardia antarctica]
MLIASPAPLRGFVAAVCAAVGAPAEVAREVADHLVEADLCGHESHGIARLDQYLAEYDRGELRPAATPEVLRSSGATVLIDAARGFGHFSTATAVDMAVPRAREHGVGAVAVRHSGHIGRLGRYCERVAGSGMIALLTMGAAGPGVGAMALPGAGSRFLAANPWATGIPSVGEPVVVDVSMTAVAEGKVSAAMATGRELPADCLIDEAGRPSTRPEDYFHGGSLLPLGGAVAPHKGFGMALAAAMLGGLGMVEDPDPTLGGSQRPASSTGRGEIGGVLLVVIDPAHFGEPGAYRTLVGEAGRHVRTAEAAGGGLTVPGLPERRLHAARQHGLPLPAHTADRLRLIGRRFGIEFDVGDGRPVAATRRG